MNNSNQDVLDPQIQFQNPDSYPQPQPQPHPVQSNSNFHPQPQPQPRRPRGFAATASAAAAADPANTVGLNVSASKRKEREKEERTKLRERHRRAITSRMLAGLRLYDNFPLPARADMNVLAALAREAGWTVETDGTTYRHSPLLKCIICCEIGGKSGIDFFQKLFGEYSFVGMSAICYEN